MTFRKAENLDGLAVLVVEDDIETRKLIRIMLEGAGARVTTVASARQALTAIARSRPHVLIVDVGLPGQDGYALMRQVQRLFGARGEKIPAVALTAYTRLEDRKRALSAGFNIHVPKPPDPGQLIAVVAELTGPGKV